MSIRFNQQSLRMVFLTILVGVPCRAADQQTYYVQTVKIPDGYTHSQKVELSARVLPHPRQRIWFDDEFFGFIHFGVNTFTGREWGTGKEEPALFNPGNLDTDSWCELLKAARMQRVVMVAKHHDGFCLWQTRYTSHSVADSPWRHGQGDVLKEVAESCKKYGLKLGIYLSPADLYQIERLGGYYGNGSAFTERVIPRPVPGRPFTDKRTFTYVLDDYNEYFMNQLFELLTEYGPIYEVWFDGANPKPGTGQTYTYKEWFDLIRQLAPDAVIFGKGPDARWCGNEAGRTRQAEYNVIPLSVSPDTYDWPDRTEPTIAGRDKIDHNTRYFHYYPAETNTSIRNGWFWRNDHEQQVRSVDDVFDIYERSVGGNSIFLLNVPPNTDGQISTRDAEVLRAVGRRISAVYSESLLKDARASVENVLDGDPDTWWQAPVPEASFEVFLPEKRTVNRFVIREAIAHRGERAEAHYLEARVAGDWVRVAEGKTIGHKRILRFAPVQADAFRLTVTQSRLEPCIAEVSAHLYDESFKPIAIQHDAEGIVTIQVVDSPIGSRQALSEYVPPIFYTLDGTTPTSGSIRYEGPFALPLGGHVQARLIVDGKEGPVCSVRLGMAPSGWTARDSQGRPDAMRALDGNPQTHWVADATETQSLTIDMGRDYPIGGLTYLPHPDGGRIESYEVHISRDGQTWRLIHRGTFGNIVNDPSLRTELFEARYTARFVKLANLRPPSSETRIGAAEIEILAAK